MQMLKSIENWKKAFLSFTANEYVVCLFVISTFISVYLQAFFMLLLPVYIFVTKQQKKALPTKIVDWLLLLFAISACISTFLFSKDGYIHTTQVNKEYFYYLSVGIIILSFDIFFFVRILTKRVFQFSLRMICVLSLFSFFVALFQRIMGIYPDSVNRPGRVASLFSNENYYGMVIEFSILITLYLFFITKERNKKRFLIFVLLANFVGLWLCQTRMAFIVIAITVFLFTFRHCRKLSYVMIALFGFATLAILYFPALLPRFDSISSYLEFRLGIWSVALNAIPNSLLLGRGYYAYSTVWTEAIGTCFPALHTHNLYIEILLNFGVIGAGFLASYVLILVFRCFRNCKQNLLKAEFTLVLTAFLSIAVHSLADTTIFWPQTGFFAVLLLAAPDLYNNQNQGETK